MATPNTPPDPPPSISAAELRRRLLASTPPPIAATASTPAIGEASAVGLQTWASNSSLDLLARLRMPGKPGSGSIPIPTARTAASPPPLDDPEPTVPVRTPVNRRTPAPNRMASIDPTSAIAGALNQLAGLGDSSGRVSLDDSPLAEIQRLRAENKEIRQLLDEMKQLLQEASDGEQQFSAKEKEYALALQEKDLQIQQLSEQLGAIEDQIANGELTQPPPVPKTRTELEEWADELEQESAKIGQEKKRIGEERRQLHEDEEALEQQMRQMEVSMARERAMMARQETELKRLSAEIQHELDVLQRGDAGLREQLSKFQRRAQEVITTKPGSGPSGPPGRR